MARAYLRPPWFLRVVGNWITSRTGTPVLEVAGRRTGQPHRVPVNVLTVDGERYLVAPRGQTDWALNLRAAGRGTITTGKISEPIAAVELPDDAKPRLIEEYKERWLGPTKSQWEALPDPADHPVFRISTAS